MAHAIYGYSGPCKNIHGHSYELHVTVSGGSIGNAFIPAPGFVLDFKELKQIAKSVIPEMFDHKIILSKEYTLNNPNICSQENLVIWDIEPTAENMLVYLQKTLREKLPPAIKLVELKLYETKNSFATWINTEGS